MNPVALALAAAAAAPAAAAELPDLYRSVASVHWVVKDLAAVKEAFGRLGFPASQDFGDVELPVTVDGAPAVARVRTAMTHMGGLEVYWVQPLDGTSAFAAFLKRHGEGVFSLNHRAPSTAALDEEVARLGRLGVSVLQAASIETGAGPLRIVHLDTKAGGKWALGLVHGSVPDSDLAPPAPPFPVKLSQFAFVARDLDAVSEFWSRLGLPPLSRTHPAITDRVYRGRPAAFDQLLGWQRHGGVAFEWIQSLAGPTVYDDFLSAHGEGLHHLGFDVDDLDKAVARWRAAGFAPVQSGAWGEKGRPHSGRYVYMDTEPVGGIFIELLWHHR